MRKLISAFSGLLFFLLFSPFCLHSVPPVSVVDAAAATILEVTQIETFIHNAQVIKEMIDTTLNTAAQLTEMKEAAQRAINNLKGIADVKSYDEFMKWHNRQLYLEQQSEREFNNLGVKIGGHTYNFSEINKIPGAVKDEFVDPFAGDFTEEQRAEMYYKLGLSPSNYAYIQTWQAREDAIAQSLLTRSQIIANEQQEAYERNSKLHQKYTRENATLDANEILKDTGITMSNVEMVLRELTGLIAQKNEYDLARDKRNDAPANAPASHEDEMKNYWKPITKGVGEGAFTD